MYSREYVQIFSLTSMNAVKAMKSISVGYYKLLFPPAITLDMRVFICLYADYLLDFIK